MLVAIGRQDEGDRRDLAVEALAALLHRCSKAERNLLWPRLAPVLEQRHRDDGAHASLPLPRHPPDAVAHALHTSVAADGEGN